MIYAEACEAQGMTLADLLKKQDEDKGIIPTWATINWSELSADNVRKVQYQKGTGVLAYFRNDTDDRIEIQIWTPGAPGAYATYGVAAGQTVKLSYGYTGNYITGLAHVKLLEITSAVGRPLYTDYGLSQVVLPASADTYLPTIWGRVCTRVNERYWKRYLACETLEEWQVLLQTMTDELAPRYERAFRMYAANSEASESQILTSMKTDYGTDGLTDEHTQTAKGTSKTTVRDTPDGEINASSNYAGTVTDGETDAGTTKSTRKGTVTVTQTGSDGVLGRVNDNIRMWRDLETDLVKEYANAFMSFIWA